MLIFAVVKRAAIAMLLSCYFLAGSVLLPLGDFSLLKDLPGMYRSYCSIKTGPPDVIDFVGDYLMGGKNIFGHNKQDAPLKSTDGSLQFQHQASLNLFFAQQQYGIAVLQVAVRTQYATHKVASHYFNYYNKLFRPPLA